MQIILEPTKIIDNIVMVIWWPNRKWEISKVAVNDKKSGIYFVCMDLSSCNSSREFFRNGTSHVSSRSDRCNYIYFYVQGFRSSRGYYALPSEYESEDGLSKSISLRRRRTLNENGIPFEINLTCNEIIPCALQTG